MTQQNYQIDLSDSTYQSAIARAQTQGKTLEHIITELVGNYAQGSSNFGLTSYIVQSGDSLSRIAKNLYGDAHKYPLIKQANNIPDPGTIWVGQVLVIPTLTETTPVPTPQPAPSLPTPPTPQPEPEAPAPSSPPAEPVSTGPTLADYVQAMPNRVRADKARGVNVTYQFQLSGNGGGTWRVTVANGAAGVAAGGGAANVTINMSGADFITLAQGRLNTTQAYQQGRMQISGDINMAAKITRIFGPWADAIGEPPPSPPPAPLAPTPSSAPTSSPATDSSGPYPQLINGGFDEYQPYIREGEGPKSWKEDRFPEEYGKYWNLNVISEAKRRIHPMSSMIFGLFTQKYYGGGGRDYHIEGRHSQVFTGRYGFDIVLYQTVTAQVGRDYTFSGSMVTYFRGPGTPPVDNKIFKTVGIDPAGGNSYKGSNIVWGERNGVDNKWWYPTVTAKAQGETITVFIRIENTEKDVGKVDLNTIHLDAFKLE